MRKLVLTVMLLFLGTPAGAQNTTAVSLKDVITLSASRASTGQAVAALASATRLTDRSRTAPRPSFTTTTGVEPDTGGERFRATGEIVFDFGSASRRIGELAAAQAQLATSSATLAIARRSSTSAAIAEYFSIIADEAQFNAQTQAVRVAKRSLAAATQRFEAGNAPEIDVERARAVLATSQAELNSAASSLDDDRVSLGTLIGRTGPVSVSTPDLPTAIPDAASVTTAALKANPNVAAARAAYAANQAALLIARGQLEPGVSLGAGVGFTRLAGTQQIGPAASVSVDLPFSTSLAKANVAAAQASILVARVSLEQSQRDAVQLALRARTIANAALARLQQLRGAYEDANRVAEAELKAYRIGAVGGADLLVAQVQANAANAAFQSAIVQLTQADAMLQFEMGDFGS